MELTDRQRRILEIIEEAVARQGYPPTIREIGQAVGLCSPASVHSQLRALERKGFIRRGSAKRRALELVRPLAGGATRAALWGARAVPLVGRVAAGAPILAEENIEEILEIPTIFGPVDECFALRVTGSSMIKAGIFDGDVVVVRRQDYANDGDIVVALIDGEATVKRFFREPDRVRLEPENDAMSPIYTREPRLVGRVIGVMRRL
ncbi:MAG: transcriptional repressor LexA [Thermoleophilia bacterium]|nr:transcriptional repressor LexA [Thermoleophilia bacterium]